MKTEKILERFAKYLFITVAVAYFGSLITSYDALHIWLGLSFLFLSGISAESYLKTRPTLLTKQHELLAKKAENNKIEANQVEEILIYAQEVESKNENLKATLKAQEAEVDRIEKAYSKLEAEVESLEAEKSELKKEISDLEDKLTTSDANANQWAAEKSEALLNNQKLLTVIKENAEHSRTIEADLQANLATAEANLLAYHHAMTDFIAKFGDGIFSNNWEIFKRAMNRLTNTYNTNRLNATTSQESRQALMLTAESVATFGEFLPQEAQLVETLKEIN